MIKKAFDFSSLLSSQVRAIIEADAESAATTADFIEQVGFEKDENSTGMGKMRMVSFSMQRRNEQGTLTTHNVQIPLLSLVPIPILNIERAELSFNLKIEDIETSETEASLSGSGKRNLSGKKASRLQTSFARSGSGKNKSTSSNTSEADLSVKMVMSQSDFPLGIERLLNLAELGANDDVES